MQTISLWQTTTRIPIRIIFSCLLLLAVIAFLIPSSAQAQEENTYEPNVEIPGVTLIQPESSENNSLLAQYIEGAQRYLISISSIAATIMFIWGAFLYLLGSSVGKVQTGKTIMLDAVIGMLLVLGATAILRILNPQLTTLKSLNVLTIETRPFYEDVPVTGFIIDPGTGLRVPITGTSLGNSCYLNTFGASEAQIKSRLTRISFLGDAYPIHQMAASDFQAALQEIERASASTPVGRWLERLKRMPPYSPTCAKKAGYQDKGSRTGGSFVGGLDTLLEKEAATGQPTCLSCHLHELGLAIDFDPCNNPMCPQGETCTLTDSRYNNIPPEVVEIFARHNIYWGGFGWKEEGKNWSAPVSRRDAMHFEWHGACRSGS